MIAWGMSALGGLAVLSGCIWQAFRRIQIVEADMEALRRDVGHLKDREAVKVRRVFGRRLQRPKSSDS